MSAAKKYETGSLSVRSSIEREQALLPQLRLLGVPARELELLRGEEHLLKILAEESQDPSANESREELGRVLSWHEARLHRLTSNLPRGT